MASEQSIVRGSGEERGEESTLREPILVSPDELSKAIMAGENIWRRPPSPVDTSVQWGASNYPSTVTSEQLERCRTVCRIPHTIEMIIPEPHERACYPRPGCVAVSDHLLRAGLRLPFHPFFRLILRSYGVAPTQFNPNSWSQMVGTWMLWRRASIGSDMPFSVFHSLFFPKNVAGGEESRGWYYLSPWGSHSPFLHGVPTSIKGWKSSWFWVSGRWDTIENDPMAPRQSPLPTLLTVSHLTELIYLNSFAHVLILLLHAGSLPKCEISEEEWDIIGQIYQTPPPERSYKELIDKNHHLVLHGLMTNREDFVNKRPPKPDLASIRRSVAEAKTLRTSSAAYKKQSERLLSLSRAGQQATEENVAEEGASLVQRRKRRTGPSGASSSTQAGAEVTEDAPPVPPTSQAIVPITAYFTGEQPRKRLKKSAGAPAKENRADFLGSKEEDLPEAVLEMLPPETASAVRVHSKYWTEDWANHAASCEIEDLLAANNACVARALSMGASAEDLVRGLRKKNNELEDQLKALGSWEAEVAKAKKETEEAEERWVTATSKLDTAEVRVNQLKNELHESASQVAALTKRIDDANEHQRIASEALEVANRERGELKQLNEAQAKEIGSLKAEVGAIGEAEVLKYKENFHTTPEYDDFANYWASWAAKEVMSRLREKHPELDINFLEEEFGGPTGGRPGPDEEEGGEAGEEEAEAEAVVHVD